MSDTNRDELIVQYLDGLLPPDQHAEVAARLLTDHQWQQAYERISMAAASVQYYGIRQEVAVVHQQFMQRREKQQGRAGIVRVLRIATAVAATLLFFFISYKGYEFYQLSGDEVYKRLYVSYPVPHTRNTTELLTSAIETAFAQKDFRAVDSLRKKSDSLTQKEQLLTGIAALENDDYSRSIQQLQPLVEMPNAFREDAQYYISLAYLKNKDYDLAIEMMELIVAQPTHPYRNQVTTGDIRDVQMLKWK